MINFKAFLVEGGLRSQELGDTFDLEKFKHDCAPFLAQRKSGDPLWRGIRRVFARSRVGMWGELFVHKNRSPMDLNPRAHAAVDNYFYEKFGWRARSQGLFCTGVPSMAAGYGALYEVFPVGQFKLLYSEEIGDLYEEWAGIWDNVEIQDKGLDEAVEEFMHHVRDAKYFYTTNVQEAINSGSEIMVNCDRYYAFIKASKHDESEEGYIDIRKELGLS